MAHQAGKKVDDEIDNAKFEREFKRVVSMPNRFGKYRFDVSRQPPPDDLTQGRAWVNAEKHFYELCGDPHPTNLILSNSGFCDWNAVC